MSAEIEPSPPIIQDVLGRLRTHAKAGDKLNTKEFLGDVFLIQELGHANNPVIQTTLELFGQARQEIVGRSIFGLLRADIINKDEEQIGRKVTALEMLKLDRVPEVSTLISNLRKAYNLKLPGEAVGIIPIIVEANGVEETRPPEEGGEDVSHKRKLIRTYEETLGELVYEEFTCRDGSIAEMIRGRDFVGQVLPVENEEHRIDDRAGVMILKDGSKIFLGADGVSMSFDGNKSADAVIRIGMQVCQIDPNKLFTNPEETLNEIGQNVKATQSELVMIYQQQIENNPEIGESLKSVLKDRLDHHGSQTTFFAVKVTPDGNAQFVSVGDGVIQVVDRTGKTSDLVPNIDSRSPEGRFTTLKGFIGKFRTGFVKLKPGQMLLFGSDGIKHNEDNIRTQLLDRRRAPDLDQVADDLTVFAYYQESIKQSVEKDSPSTTPAEKPAEAVQTAKVEPVSID